MPSIITAGDAANGLVVASGNDGAVTIQSGLAGAKVDAVVATANGTLTFLRAPIYSGSVLQVVSVLTTAQGSQSLPAQTDTIVTGLTLSVTPRGANSRFLVHARQFGESDASWNNVYNIHMAGVRVNIGGSTQSFAGLSMSCPSYGVEANDDSTPEILTLSTLALSASIIGVPITFSLVINAVSAKTIFNNRCFAAPASAYEVGSSELIVTEIGV
jgi:hypothetical protein